MRRALPLFVAVSRLAVWPRPRPARGRRGSWLVPAFFALLALGAPVCVPAQTAPNTSRGAASAAQNSALHWMQRWQQAAAQHAYAGTVTMMGGRGDLRSARIWHALQHGRQMDRIEPLSGPPRVIFRTDRSVTTLFPQAQKGRVVHEGMQANALFPGLAPLAPEVLRKAASFYQARVVAQERISNYETDVVVFVPTDGLRHAYRFWCEQKTGMLLKWQMLDIGNASNDLARARVLREVAFSDVQIPAVVDFAAMQRALQDTKGFQMREQVLQATSLEAQGWALRQPLAGFLVQQCYVRDRAAFGPRGHRGKHLEAASSAPFLQCVFSDGLSNLSIFIVPQAAGEAAAPPEHQHGALRMLTQKYGNNHQLGAVGGVPQAALQEMLKNLYRP